MTDEADDLPTRVFAATEFGMALYDNGNNGTMMFGFTVGDDRPAFVLDIGPLSLDRRTEIEAVAARLLQLLGQVRAN